jgi:hypothetical protein
MKKIFNHGKGFRFGERMVLMRSMTVRLMALILFGAVLLPMFLGMAQAVTSPSHPIELSAQSGKGYVDLNWSPPEQIGTGILTNYTVYRGTGPDNMVFLGNVSAKVTALHDAGLEKGQTFFYQVTVWGDGNESTPSNTVVVTLAWDDPVDNGTIIAIIALVIAAIAAQLAIIAIWIMVKRGTK